VIENPFAILGVEANATMDEITSAWREKVKKLHPDRYPDAPPEIVAKLNEEISRVNVSYQVLKGDLERMRLVFGNSSTETANDSASSSSRHQSRRNEPRLPPDCCDVCGSMNTRVFSFTRQTGMIFQRSVGTFEAKLCRDCALSVGRQFQSRTLTTGWWGMISAPANLFYIAKNSLGLWRATGLEDPTPPPGFRTMPMDPGRAVLLRPFSWIGIGVLALVLVVASNSESGSTGSSNSTSWQSGYCVAGSPMLYPVECSAPHNGKIVAKVTSKELCPLFAERYVQDGLDVFCIDNDF
jgi:hypothetical protein